MFRVIYPFKDIQDGWRPYKVGEEFPREGAPLPSSERLAELSGSENRLGRPLIEKVEAKAAEKPETKKKPAPRKKK